MDRYLVVFAGAGLGGLTRYIVALAIANRYSGRFPLGTFLINVTGSFLIGVLMTLLTERLSPHPHWRLFLVVGFLGGYTTFSSFEYETLVGVRSGNSFIALAYVLLSVLVGYAAVWMGAALTSK